MARGRRQLSAAKQRRCAIAVMAKAPRVGQAKTRLAAALSAEGAAEISACFIRDAIGNIAAAAKKAAIDGYVAYLPRDAEGEFREMLTGGVELLPSRRAGLAQSLHDAAADLLAAGYGSVCLINSDSPTLPTSVLVEAAGMLAVPGDRVVLGPAEDGGYYLIGLKRAHPRLFEEIAWSTPAVFAQTVERARELGLEPAVLRSWYDVDDLESLRRLDAELFGESSDPASYRAPHTAGFLRAGRAIS
jgi:rSAM/selenodomain-associated transferase 1